MAYDPKGLSSASYRHRINPSTSVLTADSLGEAPKSTRLAQSSETLPTLERR